MAGLARSAVNAHAKKDMRCDTGIRQTPSANPPARVNGEWGPAGAAPAGARPTILVVSRARRGGDRRGSGNSVANRNGDGWEPDSRYANHLATARRVRQRASRTNPAIVTD